MRLFNRGGYQKRGFNFYCLVWLFEICCKKDFFFRFYYKNDFIKEIKRFCNHFSQKLKGF